MNTTIKTKFPARFIIGQDRRLYVTIYRNEVQKAHRDLSKLVPRLVIDKNGHRKTVYVRLGLPVNGKLNPGKGEKVEREAGILVEPNKERALSNMELKKQCFEYARQTFQGKKFTNHETGREIIVSKDGLGEWKTKSKSREQILSIKIIDKLLEGSRFVKREPDSQNRRSVIGFSYFTMDCRINGETYTAIITVKETEQGGDKYYHHYLEDIKIEPYSGITRPAE